MATRRELPRRPYCNHHVTTKFALWRLDHLQPDLGNAILFKRALAIDEKVLGAEHPYVARILQNYAALLRQTGRSTEAENMEARAKAIRAKHAR